MTHLTIKVTEAEMPAAIRGAEHQAVVPSGSNGGQISNGGASSRETVSNSVAKPTLNEKCCKTCSERVMFQNLLSTIVLYRSYPEKSSVERMQRSEDTTQLKQNRDYARLACC